MLATSHAFWRLLFWRIPTTHFQHTMLGLYLPLPGIANENCYSIDIRALQFRGFDSLSKLVK